MKTSVPESLFDKVRCCRFVTLLKMKLYRRCFFMNFAKFLRASFLQNTTGRLLLIIAVSVVVKGKLANESVHYDTEIKAYQFEPEM